MAARKRIRHSGSSADSGAAPPTGCRALTGAPGGAIRHHDEAIRRHGGAVRQHGGAVRQHGGAIRHHDAGHGR
ncbi:hypothetical protein Psuf_049260 [Phytohabitans suffuscus]|uniref:Uncharacterized protein n=1 Tax=Phytohabitans suffuscus TaxID=624315 RepID=A0A6F8YNQ1_9ACTN|nr:hypothetical protein [Phytohabitans suffuscus]BCB87613.1 hypothetical protein Psuf_049260 [Phytohabitans suffuscus]